MKKIMNFLLCMMLLLTMAVSAGAEDLGTGGSDSATQSSEETQPTSPTQSSEETQPTVHTHSWNEGTVTTPADCQRKGVKTFACSGCTETKTEEIPMTSHTFGAWTDIGTLHKRTCSVCLVEESSAHDGSWTKDAASHSRTCSICSKVESGAHSHQEEVIKQPTCKEEGTRQRKCTVCGYSESIVLPKLTTHTYDSACDEECNVCAQVRTVNHTFTTSWSSDYNGHWHECTKCGQRKDEAAHKAGPAATEQQDQLCTVCNYVMAAKKPHTHSYGTEWTSDKVGHWHACTRCDEERDYASHKYDDDCDGECNVCGYKRENSHSYDDKQWQTSNFEHWNLCTVCKEESKHEKHIPGEAATEKMAQLCKVCGYELAPVLEHSHDFGNLWHQDDENHWQECSCGELSVPEAHVWDQGKENRNDTITYTCLFCGAERTEAAPEGFPWLIVILSILALGCLGGIGVLFYLLKQGKFAQEREADDEEYEDTMPDDFEVISPMPAGEDELQEELDEEELKNLLAEREEDLEEQMIDDYFASLDK